MLYSFVKVKTMNYQRALTLTLLALSGVVLSFLPSCSSCSKGKGSADSTALDSANLTLAWDSIVIDDTYYDNPETKRGPSVYVNIAYLYPKGDSALIHLFNRFTFGDSFAQLSPQEAVARYIKEVETEYIYSPDSTEGYTPEDLDQMRSHLELRNKIHYVDSFVISVEKSLSTYFMGAVHGMYGSSISNVDRKTRSIISEGDLFVDGYAADLTKILQRYALSSYGRKTQQELEEKEGIYVSDIAPNDNFTIDEKGLTYYYNPYEIAPYAVGQVMIFIPHEALVGILRPNSLLYHYLPETNQ